MIAWLKSPGAFGGIASSRALRIDWVAAAPVTTSSILRILAITRRTFPSMTGTASPKAMLAIAAAV